MMDLTAAIKRLEGSSNGITALQSAAAVLHLAFSKPGSLTTEQLDAVKLCVAHTVADVAQAGADKLCQGVAAGKLSLAAALELALAVLPASGPGTAAILGHTLASLLCQANPPPSTSSTSSTSTKQDHPGSTRWAAHPLANAWLLQPECGTGIVLGSMQALRQAARSQAPASTGAHVACWAALEPFFAFVLRQAHTSSTGSAGAAASSAALRSLALSQLMRLACSCPDQYGGPMVHLLLGTLRGCVLESPEDRCWLAQQVGDLVDLLEHMTASHQGFSQTLLPPGSTKRHLSSGVMSAQQTSESASLTSQAVEVLINVCWEAGHMVLVGPLPGGGAGPQATGAADPSCSRSVLAGLARLAALAPPEALAQRLPDLALLCTQAAGKAQDLALMLLHNSLEPTSQQQPISGKAACAGSAVDLMLAVYPTLRALAYGSAPTTRSWSAQILSRLKPLLHHAPTPSLPTIPALQTSLLSISCPDLCLLQHARHLLATFECTTPTHPTLSLRVQEQQIPTCGSAQAIEWLSALGGGWLQAQGLVRQAARSASVASLLGSRPAQASGTDGASSAPWAMQELHPAVGMVLSSLLASPHPDVALAAVSAAHTLLGLLPAASLPLLPVTLFCLRQASSKAPAGAALAAGHAAVCAGFAGLLGRMLAHPPAAPLVVRALQPLQAPTAPLVLRCLALRVVVQSWVTTGQGWAAAEAALLGYVAPGTPLPPLPLRLTRAGLVVSVCDRDPQKGLDLVSACQEFLQDSSPAIQALGLRALSRLCDTDLLDFYKAWKVVARLLPRLPEHPVAAAAWVSFLGAGHLDARAYPDQATALLQGLWAATQHKAPGVRAAAYAALLAHPLELMEELQVLPPLGHFTAPLLHTRSLAPRHSNTPAHTPGNVTRLGTDVTPSSTAIISDSGSALAAPEPAPEENESVRAAILPLVVCALRYEHENRRKFFAVAASTSGANEGVLQQAGRAVRSGAGGGAAVEREAGALRRWLLAGVPDLLGRPFTTQAQSGRHRAGPQASVLPASAAAVLLVAQPAWVGKQARQGGRSSSTAESGLMSDVVRCLGSSAGSVASSVLPAGWEVLCWRAFSSRVHAHTLSGLPEPPGTQAVGLLLSLVASGDAAQRAAAPLALAGVCMAHPSAVQDLPAFLANLANRAYNTMSSAEASSALLAMSSLSQHLHATDTTTRARLLATLTAHIHALKPLTHTTTSLISTGATQDVAIEAVTQLARHCLPQIQQSALQQADAKAAMTTLHGMAGGEAFLATASDVQGAGILGQPEQILAAVMAILVEQLLHYQPGYAKQIQSMAAGLPPVLQSALLYTLASSRSGTAPSANEQEGQGVGRRTFGAGMGTDSDSTRGERDNGVSGESQAALPCLTSLLVAVRGCGRCGTAVRQGAHALLQLLLGDAAAIVQRAADSASAASLTPAVTLPSKGYLPSEGTCGSPHIALLAALQVLTIGLNDASPEWSAGAGVSWAQLVPWLLALADSEGTDGWVRGRAVLALGSICCDAGRLVSLQAAATTAASGAGDLLTAAVQLACDLAVGSRGLSQASNCAAARVCATLALGALLVGPAAGALLLGVPATGELEQQGKQQGGLSSHGPAQLVRAVLRTLRELQRGRAAEVQTSDTPPGGADASATAALVLGFACRSLQLTEDRPGPRESTGGNARDESDGGEGNGGRSQANGGTAALQPLTRYPEEGPLHRCTAALTECAAALEAARGEVDESKDMRRAGLLMRAHVALACLAQAPRLARHDYATPLALLLQHALTELAAGRSSEVVKQAPDVALRHQSSLAERVCTAVARLMLAHAHEPSTGLASLLATQFAAEQLVSLPAAASCVLLGNLGQAARSVAPSRVARIIVDLAHAVAAQQSMVKDATRVELQGKATAAVELASSMWAGLASVMLQGPALAGASQAVQEPPAHTPSIHADVVAAALTAASVLYEALPAMASLLPGQVPSLRAVCLQGPQQQGMHLLQASTDLGTYAQGSSSGSSPLNILTPTGLPAEPPTLVVGTASQHDGSGRSDKQLRRLWSCAAHALLCCSEFDALPPSLTKDALLLQPASAVQQPEELEQAHLSCARSCQMRSLLVLCGGGAARVGDSHLAAARAWLGRQQQARLHTARDTARDTGQMQGCWGPGVQSASVLLGAALAARTPVAQQAQLICAGAIEGGEAQASSGAQLMACDIACAAVCASSCTPAAAANAVLSSSVAAGLAWSQPQAAASIQAMSLAPAEALPYLLTRLLPCSGSWAQQLAPIVQRLQQAPSGTDHHSTAQTSCLLALRRSLKAASAQGGPSYDALNDKLMAYLDSMV